MNLLALSLIVLASVDLVGAVDPSLRYWNQAQGEAAGSSFVDVAPIELQPEERWRVALGTLASEPVVWGAAIFVVTEERGSHTLVVLDSGDGSKLASERLGRLDEAQYRLAVWHDMVVAVNRKELRGFQLKGSSLRKRWSLNLTTTAPPCLADGVLYLNDAELKLHAVDVMTGEDIGQVVGGDGRPAVEGDEVFAAMARRIEGQEEVPLELRSAQLPEWEVGTGGKDWEPRVTARSLGNLPLGATPEVPYLTSLPRSRIRGLAKVLFVGTSDHAVLSSTEASSIPLSPLRKPLIVYDDMVLGLAPEGFLGQSPGGTAYILMESASFAPDLRLGPLTQARHVAFGGNFAIDLARRRFLWVLKDLDAVGPLLPLYDRRLLYWTAAGELVALGGYSDTRPAIGTAAAGAAGPETRPDAGPGLILVTGALQPGPVVTNPDGSFTLSLPGEGSDKLRIPEASVTLLLPRAPDEPASAKLLGEEYPIVIAWERALGSVLTNDLQRSFEGYREAGLVSDCQRVLAEIQTLGLDAALAARLRSSLSGVRQSTSGSATLAREHLGRTEAEDAFRDAARRAEAAVWCRDVGAPSAATLLLDGALEARQAAEAFLVDFGFQGARRPAPPDPLDLPVGVDFGALAPKEFPFEGDKVWRLWARELVPAGGRFLTAADPSWPHPTGVWATDTLAIGTRHVTLLTRNSDPALIGSLLGNAEGALRLLDGLFDKLEAAPTPLEVRLHKNRTDYLAEESPGGAVASTWSLGYYSPAEHASRFYVPEDARAEDTNLDTSVREETLQRVVVHELTHQYVAERSGFVDRQTATAHGHWIVEGFARFLEHQTVALGHPERGLDDATVLSVDLTARAVGKHKEIPLEELFTMSYDSFLVLSDEHELALEPRYSLGSFKLSQRELYYHEAGALVFFLMNRCGPNGPARVLNFLQMRTQNQLSELTESALGFQSLVDLEEAFHAFLKDPTASR